MTRPPSEDLALSPTRRRLLQVLAGLGVGPAVFQRALAAEAEKAPAVTPEMVAQAEWIAGLTLAEADRKALAGSLTRTLQTFQTLRAIPLTNDVPPAVVFNPAPWMPPAPAE